jgi:GH24 family phage-related lysozyme (muramidase)
LGLWDGADPASFLYGRAGDTPGTLGLNDHATPKAIAAASTTDPNALMVASDNCARFVASFEAMGFVCPDGKVRAYQDGGCGKGNWTVGVGEFNGRDQNSVFDTESAAWDSFVARLKGEYSKIVRSNLKTKNVKTALKQCEFDALVDLTYNHGNCLTIAGLIAAGTALDATSFVNCTAASFADRRTSEYDLYSGTTVTVTGYRRYLRVDNTNGGYCPIEEKEDPKADKKTDKKVDPKHAKKKRGYTVENSTESYVLTYT